MTRCDSYPPGVPCWVDTIVTDFPAARRFYEGVFGWEFAGPGPMNDANGEYWVARVEGRDVAGVGSMAAETPGGWTTYVAVADIDAAARAVADAGAEIVFGPVDALPAGRVAVLADPAGALLGLWEPRDRAGAQTVNEPSAWAMSRLDTPDPGTAAAFYGSLFGWETEPFGEGLTLFRRPGYVGGTDSQPVPRDVVAAMMDTRVHEAPTGWAVDFWIADADEAAARAPRLGGIVLAEPFDIPMFRTAVLAAPGGAVLQVSELRLPAG